MESKTFADLLGLEYAWPEIGDRLVKVDHRMDRTVADLKVNSHHIGVFSSGYRNAADVIVSAVERGEGIANFVCWPVLLLYRHALELGLKEAIYWGAQAFEEDAGVKKSEHRLRVLLQNLRDKSARLFPEEDQSALAAFSKVVEELDEIDPAGQSFRYPADQEGKSFDLGIELIDLAHVRRAMGKILNFLDGFSGAASNYAELAAEAHSEMYAEMDFETY